LLPRKGRRYPAYPVRLPNLSGFGIDPSSPPGRPKRGSAAAEKTPEKASVLGEKSIASHIQVPIERCQRRRGIWLRFKAQPRLRASRSARIAEIHQPALASSGKILINDRREPELPSVEAGQYAL